MDRTTLADSKPGGRSTQSPCRTIPQTVTDSQERPFRRWLQLRPSLPGLRSLPSHRSLRLRQSRQCHPSPRPCGDGDDDDDGSRPAMRLHRGRPCSRQPQALPCSVQLPAPGRMRESPSRWRRKLRKGSIGCASYSWISLIWAALNGSQMTVKRIAIPVPSGSRQDLHIRLRQFLSAATSR